MRQDIVKIFSQVAKANELREWLLALAIFLVVGVVLRIARPLIAHRIERLAVRTATRADDVIVELIQGTTSWFLVVVGVHLASLSLKIPPVMAGWIQTALILAGVLQAGVWGSRLIRFGVARVTAREIDDTGRAALLNVMGIAGRIALWAIVVLLCLQNLGIQVTALLAGLGVGGIAMALAVQNILGDLLASLSIVLDRPFVVGDFIIVDQMMGTVEHVGLKTTRLRSLSGEQLIFSNADLLKSRIRNFKRMNERRVAFQLGVTYQTPLETVERIPGILKGIVEAEPTLRFDRAHFKEFGASALGFEVVFYVLDADYLVYMDAQQRVNLAIARAFQAEGIEFAYPTQTVFLATPGPGVVSPANPE